MTQHVRTTKGNRTQFIGAMQTYSNKAVHLKIHCARFSTFFYWIKYVLHNHGNVKLQHILAVLYANKCRHITIR